MLSWRRYASIRFHSASPIPRRPPSPCWPPCGLSLCRRLRTKWVRLHTDEVFFRDTAHGFLAWALATVLVAVFATSSISSAVGTAAQSVSNVASGVTAGATQAAATQSPVSSDYFLDTLFRRDQPDANASPQAHAARSSASKSSSRWAEASDCPIAFSIRCRSAGSGVASRQSKNTRVTRRGSIRVAITDMRAASMDHRRVPRRRPRGTEALQWKPSHAVSRISMSRGGMVPAL